LADELLAHAGGRHGTLVIEAHSMGARIALEALNYLGSRIARLGDVQLVLIAPPLGGFAGANMAPYAPAFLRDVPGLLPGLDMGSHSALQTDLESMRLPASVVTRIYLGDRDGVVDAETPRFRLVVKRLRASVIRVSADHDGIVELVAMSGR
jgi:pimeloyl-ACP methyl ester carboxylesterase